MKSAFKLILLVGLMFSSRVLFGAGLPATVKIATSQFTIEGGRTNSQLFAKIQSQVVSAANQGAKILVLPEWITLDRWPKAEKISDREIVEMIARETTQPYLKLLSTLSKKHKMLIIGGSTALAEESLIYNAAPIALPDGTIKFHKKVHLTGWEREQKLTPGKHATVLETPYGKVAVLICYDAEFPDLSLELMQSRPEMILVPSMTESKSGEGRVRWALQGRVVEQTAFAAIAVTTGETWKDWHHFGKAVVLGPQLQEFVPVLAEGDGISHGLSFAELDLKLLREQRRLSTWQPAVDLKR